MAKKRRVKRETAPHRDAHDEATSSPPDRSQASIIRMQPMYVAAGLLGAAGVYATYYPSDSVAVEGGDALWFGVIALLMGTITWAASLWQGGPGTRDRAKVDLLIDAIPWALAAWVMIAAFATSPPGNLREATNEAWFWVAGAAIFTSARRLMFFPQAQRAALTLIVACAVGLAVHGLHQQFISLPQSRAEYRANPEKMLSELGLVAPAGSAQRMVFENRLMDGGPTGTFALANSMAAVLLLGMVISAGVCRYRFMTIATAAKVAWGIVLALCLIALIFARSRSATLAVITGIVLLFVMATVAARGQIGSTAKLILKGGAAIGLIALVSLLGLATLGNAEWLSQAPASVAVRLQYWRATLAMAMDRTLFAAGPGNFQSVYLQYRQPIANEQIAEPHNFLMETLATGGFIALLMLVVLIVCLAWVYFKHDKPSAETDRSTDRSANWLWLGASVSLVLIWLLAAAAGRLPDFDAHLFAVPAAIAISYCVWPVVRDLQQTQLDTIASVSLLALLIHLLAAGGWTIPGVAIHLWILAAIVSRLPPSAPTRSARPWSVAAIAVGLALLAALRWMSLGPVQDAQLAISSAKYYQSVDQLRRAQSFLDQAIDADPWSPHATLWQADLFHWQLVRQQDSEQTRQSWEHSLALTRLRGGDDPTLWEVIGQQQLHLYQRYGNDADLAAADESFTRVVDWNPWDPHAVAQLAVIADRRGDQARAKKLARRADHLAGLGNNIERALERQLLYVPERVDRIAVREPILASADELLSNHLRDSSVSP